MEGIGAITETITSSLMFLGDTMLSVFGIDSNTSVAVTAAEQLEQAYKDLGKQMDDINLKDAENGRQKLKNQQIIDDVTKSEKQRIAAVKENWKTDQIKFQNEFIEKLNIKRQEDLVQESINFDRTCLSIAKGIMGQIAVVIRDKSQTGEMKAHDLTALSTAATGAQRVAKLALGEATENMNLNADVKDSSTFRDALRTLDKVAEQRRKANPSSIH